MANIVTYNNFPTWFEIIQGLPLGCNVSIIVQNVTFLVHSFIVCELSGYFAEILDSPSTFGDHIVVALPTEDATYVKQMLDFIYTDDYTVLRGNPFNHCARLFALATRFKAYTLQVRVTAIFRSMCESRWDLSEFLDAIPLIYRSNPIPNNMMRMAAVECWCLRGSRLTGPILWGSATRNRDSQAFQIFHLENVAWFEAQRKQNMIAAELPDEST